MTYLYVRHTSCWSSLSLRDMLLHILKFYPNWLRCCMRKIGPESLGYILVVILVRTWPVLHSYFWKSSHISLTWAIVVEPKSDWCLGIDTKFHPTFHWASDHLSMLRLKLSKISKKRHYQSIICQSVEHLSMMALWCLGSGDFTQPAEVRLVVNGRKLMFTYG